MATPVNISPGFSISNWHRVDKNSLVGSFGLMLPSRMILHKCTYFRKDDGTEWISLPSEKYGKKDGTNGFAPLVDFGDRETKQRFQESALAAVRRFLREDQ